MGNPVVWGPWYCRGFLQTRPSQMWVVDYLVGQKTWLGHGLHRTGLPSHDLGVVFFLCSKEVNYEQTHCPWRVWFSLTYFSPLMLIVFFFFCRPKTISQSDGIWGWIKSGSPISLCPRPIQVSIHSTQSPASFLWHWVVLQSKFDFIHYWKLFNSCPDQMQICGWCKVTKSACDTRATWLHSGKALATSSKCLTVSFTQLPRTMKALWVWLRIP